MERAAFISEKYGNLSKVTSNFDKLLSGKTSDPFHGTEEKNGMESGRKGTGGCRGKRWTLKEESEKRDRKSLR
jgi:hypothetical protein